MLCISPIRFQTVDSLPTTVVSFTTDVPMFGKSWGEPLLLGPGSILVAHTADERIAKRELSEAVGDVRGRGAEAPGVNLAIVGYGKMGRLIEQLAPEYGFDVKLRLDIDNNAKYEGMTKENFRGIDAAVEFSTPSTAVGKYRAAGAAGRECGRWDDGMARRSRTGARGGRTRRDRARLEREFFGGREYFHADGSGGGAADGAAARIRCVGLGNSSRRKKGCVFGDDTRARREDEERAATTAPSIRAAAARAQCPERTRLASILPPIRSR